MAHTKRVFREWQHPRASNGRFARKGSPEWVKAAAEKFRHAEESLRAGTSAPGHPNREGGRPRIARGAKAERAFAAHDATVRTGLAPHQPTEGPARRPASTTRGKVSRDAKAAAGQREHTMAALEGRDRRDMKADSEYRAGMTALNAESRDKYLQLEDRLKGLDPESVQAKAIKRRMADLRADTEGHGGNVRESHRGVGVDTPRDSVKAGGVSKTTTPSEEDRRREDMAARARQGGLGTAEASGTTGRQAWATLLSGPQKEAPKATPARTAEENAADRQRVADRTAATLAGGAPKRGNVFDNPEFANSTGKPAKKAPDGVRPTDGRPDVSAILKMQGRNRDYDLGNSRGRDRSAAPDMVRAGNGYMDGQPASAEIMNPSDGTGDYRYRIYNDQTGATLEEGTDRDLGDVKAKVDRMYSSQRGSGMARTAGNEVHYEARSVERKKDPSRGDFGKGPFYDHQVVEVRKDGTEYVKVKTSRASSAAATAADMNAKEGVTPPSAGGSDTPQIDVIKDLSGSARASLDAGTNPATAYHTMDRTNLLFLARQAGVKVRGKSNDDIATELTAKDAERKAARAAKRAAVLNPGGTGDGSSTQHEVHTPAVGRAAVPPPRNRQLDVENLPADRGTKKLGWTSFDHEGQGGRIMMSGKRVGSQADRYDRHKNLTREQFDALPETRQRTVLDELRQVRDSGETKSQFNRSHGIGSPSSRSLTDADHVAGAKAKLRELTYTAPPPVDNSIEGKAARLKAGDRYAADGTIEELNQVAKAAGLAGFPASWKRQKGVDYLRNQVLAGDRMKAAREGHLAAALRGATPAEAMAVLEARDAEHGVTISELGTAAKLLGIGSLTGDKSRRMHALSAGAGKAPSGPPAASGDPKLAKLTDERLAQGLQMHGTNTPQGRKVVAEMQRRGLDPNVVPRVEEPSRPKAEAAGAATGQRAANLDKARAAQRSMRAEELMRSTEPKDNGAKIKALEDGTIDRADLYKTASAGPSGQRAQVLVGKVRHTPDDKAGEFKITDRDGRTTGWASRTVRNGETVYSVHSEGPNGEQRLEGWSGELATAADVLNQSEFVARGYTADARRASSGTWESNPTKGMSLPEMELHAARDELRKAKANAAREGLAPYARKSADREVAHRQRLLDELVAEQRGQVDTSRDKAHSGGAGNTPTTEANMTEHKPNTARMGDGYVEVTGPDGRVKRLNTKRQGLNHVAILNYKDGTWSATLTTAATEQKAIQAARSTNPHIPAERIHVIRLERLGKA